MDRNPILQDLHNFNSTNLIESNTMFQLNESNTFLDQLEFTNFDSRLTQESSNEIKLNSEYNQTPIYYQQPSNYLNNNNQQILLQRLNSNGSTNSSNHKIYYPMLKNNQHIHTQSDLLHSTILSGAIQKKKPKTKKKKIPKIIDPNAPPKPKRKTGLNKPLLLSPALSELMEGATELSRPELVQKLWKYIKLNNLQDPSDRRFILCDDGLKKIFDQDRINSFGMNKDLSAHLTKIEDPVKEEKDDFLINL